MKKHLRLASGLAGLGFAVVAAAGISPARAEGVGRHDDAATLRVEKAAGAPATDTGAAQQTVAADTGAGRADVTRAGTAMGFTGSAGTKTVHLSTGKSASRGSYGRADAAALPAGDDEVTARSDKGAAPKTVSATSNRPYHSQITKHARANGIPVALALAVVRVESNYNPKARGRAGEIGLMQIKPQTARGMGYSGSSSGLYDPDTNLSWGMKYLAGAYKRAGGDTCGTIMRYQGGHYAKRMSRTAVAYCSKVKRHMADT